MEFWEEYISDMACFTAPLHLPGILLTTISGGKRQSWVWPRHYIGLIITSSRLKGMPGFSLDKVLFCCCYLVVLLLLFVFVQQDPLKLQEVIRKHVLPHILSCLNTLELVYHSALILQSLLSFCLPWNSPPAFTSLWKVIFLHIIISKIPFY